MLPGVELRVLVEVHMQANVIASMGTLHPPLKVDMISGRAASMVALHPLVKAHISANSIACTVALAETRIPADVLVDVCSTSDVVAAKSFM